MKSGAIPFLALFILANGTKPSPQAASVWKQERIYWQATVGQNDTAYQSLWHPDFTGWPCDENGPVSGLPPRMSPDGVKRSYVMDKQATAEAPRLVSTFYHVRERDVQPSGKVEISDYDVTHTWVPTPSGWKIISGMCKHPGPAR
jgi:hypothetical protein